MNIMLKSICRFAVMGLGLAGFAPTALAGESQTQPAPHRPFMDYDGSFRVMGQTDEESDSDCIGDMRTLLCAFETLMAASERGNGNLMDIARGKTDPQNRKPFIPKYGSKGGYRVLALRLFSLSDVPAPEFNRYDIQPWDVAIYYDTCNVTYGPCENLFGETGSGSSAIFRKGPFGWYMAYGVLRGTDLTDTASYDANPLAR